MPAKRVFLDTNGWLALLNSADSLHFDAKSVWADLSRQRYSIVLTEWVVAETGNGLARTSARSRFPRAVEIIRSSPHASLVPISAHLFQRALDLYERRSDKTWGLVDCASFLVMQDQGISEVFTNDHHFEQAGYRCLLPLP